MFILAHEQFSEFRLDGARAFVECWGKYYRGTVNHVGGVTPIDYLQELNLGLELGVENVRRLLRWKDPTYLTDPLRHGSDDESPNLNVGRVLARLNALNAFRRCETSEDEFLNVVGSVFPQGLVWQIFLFHIAKPVEYPIADQHVFRAYGLHSGRRRPTTWREYLHYKTYFEKLVHAYHADASPDVHSLVNIRKNLDGALMAFGQFLKRYG